jgi:hypothetical protein
MDQKDLIQKLEGADPPRVDLPDAKARLRRELLTSSHFERAGARTHRFRLGVAAVAAVVVAVVLFVQLPSDRVSARALIDSIEVAYDSRSVSGAVHYLRQALSLPDDHRFEVETWAQDSEKRMRVRLSDARSGETLAHSLFDGDRSYGLPEGSSRIHSESKITVRKHGGAPPPRSRMLAVVIMRVSAEDEWTDDTVVRALVLDNGFNRDAFAAMTPREVVRHLSESPEVEYVGASYAPGLNAEIETLEIRNSGALPFAIEFPLKYMDRVRWFLSSVISEDISFEMDSRFVEFLEQNDFEGTIKLRPVESIQRVEVHAGSASIHRTTLIVRENGMETYRAEVVFAEDRYLPAAPDMFDPSALGLTLLEPDAIH